MALEVTVTCLCPQSLQAGAVAGAGRAATGGAEARVPSEKEADVSVRGWRMCAKCWRWHSCGLGYSVQLKPWD